MTVIRVNKTTDYTVMSNTHFKEKEMSLRAKGLLSLMLSLPDEWDYSAIGLAQLSKDGRDSVKQALKELETFGYLIRIRATDECGKFKGYDYIVYESPQTEKPLTEKPLTENPSTEKPLTENPPQLNTNISNTNILNNNILNTNKLNTKEKRKKETHIFVPPTLEEVEAYCKKRNNNVNAKHFFDYYDAGDWVDAKGNKVRNWKQKIITWEKSNKEEKKQEAQPSGQAQEVLKMFGG